MMVKKLISAGALGLLFSCSTLYAQDLTGT